MLCAVSLAAPATAQRGAILRGRVLMDSTKQPVPGAEVVIGDRGPAVAADSLGRFRLAGIPPGQHRVLVRRMGFEPFSAPLRFSQSDSLDVEFFLEPVAQSLPRLEIVSPFGRRAPRDFERRRQSGVGQFLTAEELEQSAGSRLSEKLRRLRGLEVVPGSPGDQVTIGSTRGPKSIRYQPQRATCPATIVLDGVFVSDFNINSVHPGDVAAIEWYAGSSEIPPRYGGVRAPCSLLMIWTK